MEKIDDSEKPAWVLYFDGEFYDNYLNNLRKLNISRVNNYNINDASKHDTKAKSNVLPDQPTVIRNSFTLDEPKKKLEDSETDTKWRKRRTNGFVIIGILLIAGLATATSLVIHLVFIEGNDHFSTSAVHESSRKNVSIPSTLPSAKSTLQTTQKPEDEGRDLFATPGVHKTSTKEIVSKSTILPTTESAIPTTQEPVTEEKTSQSTIFSIGMRTSESTPKKGSTKDENAVFDRTTSANAVFHTHLHSHGTIKTSKDSEPMTEHTTLEITTYKHSIPTTTHKPMTTTTQKSMTTTTQKPMTTTTHKPMTTTTTADPTKQTTKRPVTSTTRALTAKIKQVESNPDDFFGNFIVLDKAGTTMDLDTGSVMEADESRHVLDNTEVTLIGGVHDTAHKLHMTIVKDTSTTAKDPETYCKNHPDGFMLDPTNCARYYNCSDPSTKQGLDKPHLSQCKYPLLFNDTDTGCTLFIGVVCGERYEPKAPCEYVENKCFGSNCWSCEEKSPSCVGYNDGTFEHSSTPENTKYIICFKERTVGQFTCKSGTYDKVTEKCIDNV